MEKDPLETRPLQRKAHERCSRLAESEASLLSSYISRQAPFLSQYWDADEPPHFVSRLTDTFRRRNPDFHHQVFSRREASDFIAAQYGPREFAAFRACALPSMQSDYFRYCAVLALGGVYSDVGFECTQRLRPLLDNCEEGVMFSHPRSPLLNGRNARAVINGFFAFRRPGHPFLRLALDIATANVEARIPERVWPAGDHTVLGVILTVGPGVFALMRLLSELGSFDAFITALSGSPAEPFAELYCEATGSFDRVTEAVDGVSFLPHRQMSDWVTQPATPLPYKETEMHWPHTTTAIFMPPASGALPNDRS
jgi:hypothetical protein